MKKHKKYLFNVFKALISEEYNKFYEKQKKLFYSQSKTKILYFLHQSLCLNISGI
jgi:hypothetical protein